MNKLAINVPNKIKQPAQCCIYCGKSYKKKINLDKHLVICELLQNAKKPAPQQIDEEEEQQLPSQRRIFQMLIELGQKYSRLEEKVEEINKWVVKKKKKINVLDWLNANIIPSITFDTIIEKIIVEEKDVINLFDNTFYDILNEVFSRTIYKFNQDENPIFAFIQKINVFFIYTRVYEEKFSWIELSTENLIKFLNKVHMKFIKAFYDWKKTKTNEIKADDIFATRCNKTSVKIMSIEFKQESILSKVKSQMFAKMKTDVKALVEYEFEI